MAENKAYSVRLFRWNCSEHSVDWQLKTCLCWCNQLADPVAWKKPIGKTMVDKDVYCTMLKLLLESASRYL